MAAGRAQDNAVDLVVRFTTSIPDMVLTMSSPLYTSTLSLKRQIRSRLPSEAASDRLRLISAGKVLADTAALGKAIAIPPPPPRQTKDHSSSDVSSKGKGKAPLTPNLPTILPHARVYIHCSIGDALSSEELASEASAAEAADAALASHTQSTMVPDPAGLERVPSGTAPIPRGFDRLLNAGFSAAEVATLRTQFLAIQAHTHTPDTMPTGDELRALEERWLDGDAAGNAGGGASDGDGDGGFGAEDGGLDDMLWGNIMGFFWPVAAVCWLMREEGVWSRRRQIAVLSGMLVNLTFGLLRLTN